MPMPASSRNRSMSAMATAPIARVRRPFFVRPLLRLLAVALVTMEVDAERLRRLFRRLGIDEIPIRTDTGYIEPLLRFFRLREQRGRRG